MDRTGNARLARSSASHARLTRPIGSAALGDHRRDLCAGEDADTVGCDDRAGRPDRHGISGPPTSLASQALCGVAGRWSRPMARLTGSAALASTPRHVRLSTTRRSRTWTTASSSSAWPSTTAKPLTLGIMRQGQLAGFPRATRPRSRPRSHRSCCRRVGAPARLRASRIVRAMHDAGRLTPWAAAIGERPRSPLSIA